MTRPPFRWPTYPARATSRARALRAAPEASIRFLTGGARAWYPAFELPVPLFSEKAPPRGYTEALAVARAFFADPTAGDAAAAVAALQTLARLDFQPSLLTQAKKPKAAKKRKKIAGGCG